LKNHPIGLKIVENALWDIYKLLLKPDILYLHFFIFIASEKVPKRAKVSKYHKDHVYQFLDRLDSFPD